MQDLVEKRTPTYITPTTEALLYGW
jgi:hypothetical protein